MQMGGCFNKGAWIIQQLCSTRNAAQEQIQTNSLKRNCFGKIKFDTVVSLPCLISKAAHHWLIKKHPQTETSHRISWGGTGDAFSLCVHFPLAAASLLYFNKTKNGYEGHFSNSLCLFRRGGGGNRLPVQYRSLITDYKEQEQKQQILRHLLKIEMLINKGFWCTTNHSVWTSRKFISGCVPLPMCKLRMSTDSRASVAGTWGPTRVQTLFVPSCCFCQPVLKKEGENYFHPHNTYKSLI